MTQPLRAQLAASEESVTPDLLEKLIAEYEENQRLRAYRTGDQLKDAEMEIVAEGRSIAARRSEAIKATLPSDWVMQGDYLYLQDCGVQRINPIFRISYDSPTTPVASEDEEGHITYESSVRGRSDVLRTERTEIGSRSTATQLYRKQWENETTSPAAKREIEGHVKKCAITNAHGRVGRALSGLGRMTRDEVLRVTGWPKSVKFCEVDYQKGGAGGNARIDAPSEGQLKRMAVLATKERMVVDAGEYNKFLAVLQHDCPSLTIAKASEVMKWMEENARAGTPVTRAAFAERVGYVKPAEPQKPSGVDSAAAEHPSPAPPPGAPADLAPELKNAIEKRVKAIGEGQKSPTPMPTRNKIKAELVKLFGPLDKLAGEQLEECMGAVGQVEVC